MTRYPNPVHVAAAIAVAIVLPTSCRAPDAGSSAWWRALNAMDEGRYDLARGDLEAILADDPADLEVCTLLARSWSRGTMQSPARAIEAWQHCQALEPTDEGRVEIARAHLRLGDHEKALAALQGAAPTAEVLLLRGESLLRLDPTAALRELERGLDDFPPEAALLALTARAAELEDLPARALEYADRALELDPLDDRTHYLRARLLQALDRADEAATAFERYELVSRIRGVAGRPTPTATEQLRFMQELGVGGRGASMKRIELLAEVGRGDEAMAAIEEVLRDDDPDAMTVLRLENTAARLGRYDDARTLLGRIEISRAEPAIRREVEFRRAHLLHLSGDTEAALSEIEALLERDPRIAKLLDLHGRLLQASGDEAAALHSFSRALELAPWRVDTRLALCELELRHSGRKRVQSLLDAAPEPSGELDSFRLRHGLP
ncbi:MAG: hypothetical protein R2991_02825 [Thermoanaerobaculia bacterium]